MTRIQSLLTVALCAILAGCFGASATVVDSGGGQTVGQAQAAPYNGPQKRIAVTTFEYRAAEGAPIGGGMSDMLTSALFNSGRFIVLERERLSEVTREQDLSNSSRFKKETAA